MRPSEDIFCPPYFIYIYFSFYSVACVFFIEDDSQTIKNRRGHPNSSKKLILHLPLFFPSVVCWIYSIGLTWMVQTHWIVTSPWFRFIMSVTGDSCLLLLLELNFSDPNSQLLSFRRHRPIPIVTKRNCIYI